METEQPPIQPMSAAVPEGAIEDTVQVAPVQTAPPPAEVSPDAQPPTPAPMAPQAARPKPVAKQSSDTPNAAIIATVIIVVVVAGLIVYAYLKSR